MIPRKSGRKYYVCVKCHVRIDGNMCKNCHHQFKTCNCTHYVSKNYCDDCLKINLIQLQPLQQGPLY